MIKFDLNFFIASGKGRILGCFLAGQASYPAQVYHSDFALGILIGWVKAKGFYLDKS